MPDYSGFSDIAVSVDDGVMTILLNRPQALNAFNDAMHDDLARIFRMISDDGAVNAVLLRGAGKAFSAGADKNEIGRPAASADSVGIVNSKLKLARELLWNLLEVEQPVVSAVHGYAMGLGATLALFCDCVVAADDAVIADIHVNFGLVAGDGGTVIWPLLLPLNTAKYYLLTGEKMSGIKAAELGLAIRSVPADSLISEAEALARQLAAMPPLASRGTKRGINMILKDRLAMTLDTSLIAEGMTMLSDDHVEAGAAFAEGRPPVFRRS
jgi:enoyl-CoA hydratase